MMATTACVKALNGVELLLRRVLGCPRVACLGFFDQKVVCCVCFFVRRQICCLSRASGVIAVVSGPSMVSVVFRLVRFWLRLFDARFWLANVG